MRISDWSSDVCSSDLMVDWARSCGFPVVAAGKGTKYLPSYHDLTPADVWDHYGIAAEEAAAGGMNAQMFNSFMDGTKSAIEMAAVANACDLAPARGGRSEEHTSELQSLMRISYAVFCLKNTNPKQDIQNAKKKIDEEINRT